MLRNIKGTGVWRRSLEEGGRRGGGSETSRVTCVWLGEEEEEEAPKVKDVWAVSDLRRHQTCQIELLALHACLVGVLEHSTVCQIDAWGTRQSVALMV